MKFEHHRVFLATWRKGMQYKVACVAAIYDKSLRLPSIGSCSKSNDADYSVSSAGRIVNLASRVTQNA